MGRVKALWQEERDRRWQEHYDAYCFDEFGGGQPEGRQHDEAVAYANEAMEEEDAEREAQQ